MTDTPDALARELERCEIGRQRYKNFAGSNELEYDYLVPGGLAKRILTALRPFPTRDAVADGEGVAGHWDTSEGAEKAREYAAKDRTDLTYGDMSDFALANGVFLADRFSLDLIIWQTAAKERIRWLSTQLALRTANTGRAEVLEEAARVCDERKAAIENVLNRGKGTHGQADYVRDATWDGWWAERRAAESLAAAIRALSPLPPEQGVGEGGAMCEDCPPVGYPTDETRCLPCPRRGAPQ